MQSQGSDLDSICRLGQHSGLSAVDQVPCISLGQTEAYMKNICKWEKQQLVNCCSDNED